MDLTVDAAEDSALTREKLLELESSSADELAHVLPP